MVEKKHMSSGKVIAAVVFFDPGIGKPDRSSRAHATTTA